MAQIRAITDLLLHANEDDMSMADRVFARAALALLRSEAADREPAAS